MDIDGMYTCPVKLNPVSLVRPTRMSTADVNLAQAYGPTALKYVNENGHTAIAQVLLQAGVGVAGMMLKTD